MNTNTLAGEPSPFDAWPPGRDVAIIPTLDRTISTEWMRKRSGEVGAEVWEVEAGHCPHVSRSEEIAEILSGLA